MKKYISLLAFLSVSVFSFSQVTIDYSSHAPVLGDFNSYHSADFISPGQSGKNVVWDFSGCNFTGKTTNSVQMKPDAGEKAMLLIEPTFVINENGNLFYHEVTEKTYSLTGFKNDDFLIVYEEPLKRMVYPFSYASEITGTLKAVATNINNSEIEINGNYKVQADAFGFLILPGNIKKNVLRVCQFSSTVQVSRCQEVIVDSYKYMWYSAEDRYPVATTVITSQHFSNGDVKNFEETWINSKVIAIPEAAEVMPESEVSAELAAFNVFPNPFYESAEISFQLTGDAEVSLSMHGVAGNKIKTILDKTSLKAGQYNFNIKSVESALKPGMYFLKLSVNDKIYSKKIIKNQ